MYISVGALSRVSDVILIRSAGRRRSVKYRTTELNFPTDFIEATPRNAALRRALPLYRRVIGTFYHASDPARRTDHRRGDHTGSPPDRRDHPSSAAIALVPIPAQYCACLHVRHQSPRCQFIRLTQSQHGDCSRCYCYQMCGQPVRVRARRSHREIGRAYRC